MAIEESDISVYLSGGAANADPNAALGGAKSSTEWTGGSLHDLWDVVTGDENAESDVEYRGVYLQNDHGSLTWIGVKAWIESQTAGGATLAIALADEGVDGTMETIADEDTAPAGPTFSAPSDKASGLSIGDLAPGEYHGIWIRRTAADSAAIDNDGAQIRFAGDTAQ